MSLRTFASLCNISHTTLDNIEKGVDFRTKKATNPSVYTLQKIAKAANVPLSYITGEDEIQNSPEQLSEGERRLINCYNKLSDEAQEVLSSCIESLGNFSEETQKLALRMLRSVLENQ
jgi:transcriptional regulator with XRE-family HTH domain